VVVSDFKSPISVGQISPKTVSLIIEDVVATVLDLITMAWPCIRQDKRVQPTDKEDDITDQLRWEMVKEKKRRHPQPQLVFLRETQRDDADKQYPRGLIDVYVGYSFDETEYFAMECKRIDDRHETPARKYIEDGVCRFVIGKYSPGHPYGAMIGYVTEGTPETAAEFLGNKLLGHDKKRTKLRSKWGWRRELRFGRVPNLHSTKHSQEGTRNTILLLHLFLAFSD
jgi:hypothetical protein